MTIKENKIKNPTKPINYEGKIEEFLIRRNLNYFKQKKGKKSYIEQFKHQVEINQIVSSFRFRLKDVLDIDLVDKFKDNCQDFFKIFRNELFQQLKFSQIINEIFEKEKIKPEYLHIIADPIDFDSTIPLIDNISIDLSKLVGKYCIFRGHNMTKGLDKENHYHSIKFQCRICAANPFDVYYDFGIVTNRYKPLNKCNSCNNRNCIDIIGGEPFERRNFKIEDLDIQNTRNYLNCRILRNTPYFIEKMREIDLNEEIEILGILRRDNSDYFNRKDVKGFEYYIDVYDIDIKKSKRIDNKVITVLKEKLKDPIYFEKLIDSTNHITYLIDLFYPTKLLTCMSVVSGGSWNQRNDIRDTLNSIIAGGGNTYKSRCIKDIKNIVGERTFYRIEGSKITEAGLLGTTERNPETFSPDIRYGFYALYSDGTICFDEAQDLVKNNKMSILNTMRYLEDGTNRAIQDAVHFTSNCWESVILAQNYLTPNGFYDSEDDIIGNLGWNKSNAETLLQRFDLYYNIPQPDYFTKFRVYNNLELINQEKMVSQIADDLEIQDFEFPPNYKTKKEKIIYIQFNLLQQAKKIYRTLFVPERIRKRFGKIYKEALKSESEIELRSLNTVHKSLKALAALRLSEKVENRDFNYLRQDCMKYILAYRNSAVIEKEFIVLDRIFKETFEKNILHLIELESEPVHIKEHIEAIRTYIRNHYYTGKLEDKYKNEINNYMPENGTLKDNWKYRKLLENNKKWLEDLSIGLILIYKTGTFFSFIADNKKVFKGTGKIISESLVIEKASKREILMNRLNEIFEGNNRESIEREGIVQVLELEYILDKKYIEAALKELIRDGILSEPKKGFITFLL